MSDALPLPARLNVEHYKKLAKGLVRASKAGHASSPLEKQWFAKGDTKRTLTGAQFFIARAHGFLSWPKFAKHVEALSRAGTPVSQYEAAAEAIVSGDIATLRKLLTPQLVRARSTREHRSTLLHYVSANGIEDFRQKTPSNIVAITKLLLEAGADVNAESDAYGGGSTALGLTATSAHPQEAGVMIDLLETLLAAGARIGPRSVRDCLANGQPEAAEYLASRGAPVDFEGAGGLGRVDLLRAQFDPEHPQLGGALRHACFYGRVEAAAWLLAQQTDPNLADTDGATSLHSASYGAWPSIVAMLLEHGARHGIRERVYNSAPLDVAIWVWDNARQPERRERCYDVVALLARAGATLDPNQWGPEMFAKIAADPRMIRALVARH